MGDIMTKHATAAFAALLFAFFLSPAASASPDDPVGDWMGTLTTPMGKLRLLLTLSRDADGRLTAELESPDQAPGQKIPVSEVAIDGDRLTFASEVIGASYAGVWRDNMWDGTFLQGMPFELDLKRGGIDPASLLRPQDPREPLPYRAEDVRFDNDAADGVTLAGTLTLPDGDGPFPAAVLISGSGPQDRNEELMNHRPFLVLADYLTRRGIAVLRYDDRGFGESTGEFEGATSADFATDANAAFQYLAGRDDIRKDAIGFIGHSEGGMVAPIAADANDRLAFIVFLAAPGDELFTEFLNQQERLVSSYGTPPSRLGRYKDAMGALLVAARDANTQAEAESAMMAALTPARRRDIGFNSDEQVDEILGEFAGDWFRYFLNFDPKGWLAPLDMPVLALFGELDIQVEPTRNAAAMEKLWSDHPDATVRVLPKLNHLFQTSETGFVQEYAQIEETVAPVALDAIGDWLSARFQ